MFDFKTSPTLSSLNSSANHLTVASKHFLGPAWATARKLKSVSSSKFISSGSLFLTGYPITSIWDASTLRSSYTELTKTSLAWFETTITRSISLQHCTHWAEARSVSMPAVTPIFFSAKFCHSFGIKTCIEILKVPWKCASLFTQCKISLFSSVAVYDQLVFPQLVGSI